MLHWWNIGSLFCCLWRNISYFPSFFPPRAYSWASVQYRVHFLKAVFLLSEKTGKMVIKISQNCSFLISDVTVCVSSSVLPFEEHWIQGIIKIAVEIPNLFQLGTLQEYQKRMKKLDQQYKERIRNAGKLDFFQRWYMHHKCTVFVTPEAK